jgi:hypothetical protein
MLTVVFWFLDGAAKRISKQNTGGLVGGLCFFGV